MKIPALVLAVLLASAWAYDSLPSTKVRRIDQRIIGLQADLRELDAELLRQRAEVRAARIEGIAALPHAGPDPAARRADLQRQIAALQAQRQTLR